MGKDPVTGVLEPLDFNHLVSSMPEFKLIQAEIDVRKFDPPIDSSDMDPMRWAEIVSMIANNYNGYDGFVILHGTDTIGRLSTGQRARVELAAGFAKRVPYYLMDEPFLGKDPFTRRDFIKLMSATLTGGETLLLSTHYIEDVEHFLDRALILHDGRIAEDLQLDTLAPGDSLLAHMASACHWDPKRYLAFEEE